VIYSSDCIRLTDILVLDGDEEDGRRAKRNRQLKAELNDRQSINQAGTGGAALPATDSRT
jgi:hypothetical protein